MKVVSHIGRLVVHGAAEFDRQAFAQSLQEAIRCRLPEAAGTIGVAQRFDVAGGSFDAFTPKPTAGSTEVVAASILARRLVP